ncbi:hypothetical protein NM688_g4939 [Phlebia brevispora]|uniref:Uncharacterized protein n=1 Tax=Phlebia brevispora TaxID=194682 RepID=A0ACC1T187_9APHY|nr:hypothetical protein NM688_g4939 [Phlebia brevispora]
MADEIIMIGPETPAHAPAQRSTTPSDEEDEPGPSISVGPVIPPEVSRSLKDAPPVQKPINGDEEESDDDDDDYVPALPPDLAAARASHTEPATSSRRVQGPALPPSLQKRYGGVDDEDEDEDIGPMPMPGGVSIIESDGVKEFLEKEERRRQQVEEASKPKALKREEWMLVPPSSSDLLGSIDPTKLTKPRQFSRSTAPARNVDTSLWTETPAERQQRLADEVAGKRRRAVNADPDVGDESTELEARKRRRRDEEIRRGVDQYTKQHRGGPLLEQHAEKSEKEAKTKGDEDEGPPVIWDHTRDMAVGGRLMDDSTRNKYIREARGLGDRFGAGKSGGFL